MSSQTPEVQTHGAGDTPPAAGGENNAGTSTPPATPPPAPSTHKFVNDGPSLQRVIANILNGYLTRYIVGGGRGLSGIFGDSVSITGAQYVASTAAKLADFDMSKTTYHTGTDTWAGRWKAARINKKKIVTYALVYPWVLAHTTYAKAFKGKKYWRNYGYMFIWSVLWHLGYDAMMDAWWKGDDRDNLGSRVNRNWQI